MMLWIILVSWSSDQVAEDIQSLQNLQTCKMLHLWSIKLILSFQIEMERWVSEQNEKMKIKISI